MGTRAALSPMSQLNGATTPPSAPYDDDDDMHLDDARPTGSFTRRSTGPDSLDGADSSPFVSSVDDSQSQSSNQENVSPNKDKRRSRIMSGHDLTPLKMLQRTSSDGAPPQSLPQSPQAHQPQQSDDKLAPPPKSPRKSISPMRRFPIRVGSMDGGTRSRPQSMYAIPPVREQDQEQDAAHQSPVQQQRPRSQELSLEEAIAQNPGVKHAIEIFEDTLDSIEDDDDDDLSISDDGTTVKVSVDSQHHGANGSEDPAADETMLSAFSDFSAIPNLTTFARLGGRTPSQMASQGARRDSNTATNLLDFTDNLRYPGGRTSPTKGMAATDAKKTPQRQNIANLLDFEIPPMPTPRSLPSITARELESLKSNFMSEISSLKATLSGKEAEAVSLKTALMDAEKRAGESSEQLREERSLKEQCMEDKETWEKRGKEMETVLRQVKDEIMMTTRERETLEAKLEESEGRREAAEMMAQEAESKMAAMRASKAGADVGASPGGGKSSKATQREIELAVDKVARELHAAYKSKHEAKVAALKKNYEQRWDKKIREMEARIEELIRENEEMRVSRDATLTKAEAESTEQRVMIKGLRAEVERLEAEMRSVQGDNAELRQALEMERVEKGELVTLAEELMQMQQAQSILVQNNNSNNNNNDDDHMQQRTQERKQKQQYVVEQATPKRVPQRASAPVPPRSNTLGGGGIARSATTTPRKTTAPSPSGIPGSKSTFRNSMIGRPPGVSGLKAPGQSTSRIGGPLSTQQQQHHQRMGSNAVAGGGRPPSGLARPGNLMSSIQQMGSYHRGRGE